MSKRRELEMLNANRDQLERWSVRRKNADVVDGLADEVISSGGIIENQRADGLSVLLLSGDHNGMTITGEKCSVRSVAGARIVEHVRIEGSAVFDGVTFSSVGKSWPGPLVTIGPFGRVTFSGCVFEREKQHSATFIKVESGGKVVLNGIHFGPKMISVGNVVDNLGLNTDVGVIGVNETGNAMGTVTPVFVT